MSEEGHAGSAASADEGPADDPRESPADRAGSSDSGVDSETDAPRGRRARKPRQAGRWWELPVLFLIAVAVAIVVKSFIVQPFYIPSESMEKTLHGCTGCNGDKILVNKVVYDTRGPHPGEIVVFSAPDGWEPETLPVRTNAVSGAIRWFGQLVGFVPPNEKDLVKRVIAVGGQTVKCCDAQGRVQVSDNGPGGPWRSLDEPYVFQNSPEQPFVAVTVPKGRLWVMGDHRDNSADSRYHGGTNTCQTSCDPVTSTVPVSAVIGKAFVVAWPPSRWSTLGTPKTFTSKASAFADGALPSAVGAIAVFPPFLIRRRRRR